MLESSTDFFKSIHKEIIDYGFSRSFVNIDEKKKHFIEIDMYFITAVIKERDNNSIKCKWITQLDKFNGMWFEAWFEFLKLAYSSPLQMFKIDSVNHIFYTYFPTTYTLARHCRKVMRVSCVYCIII